MKKCTNLVLIGFALLLTQSSDISAITMDRSRWQQLPPSQLVEMVSEAWKIKPIYKELLHAAAEPNSILILKFNKNRRGWANRYPSNVLRAAKDIAEITQGANSSAYQTLERMLSYK